jgi:NADPH:quinone reductase-like Zn-dependent oxidoreductase
MPVPNKHRVAFIHEKGGKPTLGERTLGELKEGEIAIKVTATAINPVDWKIRDIGLSFLENWNYPVILGSDAAGVVAAMDHKVHGFKEGERVFFQSGYGNDDVSTFQEYVKLPMEVVARTPKNIRDEEAAGIVLATMAAATAFYDKTGQGLMPPWENGGNKVGKGKAVVVLGGSSSVGQYAIQLARLSGFGRIVTNASPKHHEWLKKLGAHVTLDRNASTPEDFRKAIGGLPLVFVSDSISTLETQKLGVEIIHATSTQNSRIVTVQPVDDEAKALGQEKETKVAVQQIMGLALNPDLRHIIAPLTDSLGGEDGWIAKGLFKPNRVAVVEGGLENLQDALEMNRKGVSGKKVIVRLGDMNQLH